MERLLLLKCWGYHGSLLLYMVKGYYGYYLTKISFMVIMVILVIDCYLAIKTWLSWLLNYPTETSMLCRGIVVMMLYLVFGLTGLRPFL